MAVLFRRLPLTIHQTKTRKLKKSQYKDGGGIRGYVSKECINTNRKTEKITLKQLQYVT